MVAHVKITVFHFYVFFLSAPDLDKRGIRCANTQNECQGQLGWPATVYRWPWYRPAS